MKLLFLRLHFAVFGLALPLAAAAEAPLVVESFDIGHAAGSAPVGFHVEQPPSTEVVVTGERFSPASPPFALALSDNSPVGRAEAHRALDADVESGHLEVRVYVGDTAHAPAGVQLRSRTGVFLAAVLLSSNGRMGYDHGAGTVHTAHSWTPREWATVRIQWFADGSFDAYVGAQRFARRIPFAGDGHPGRIVLTSGFGSGTGQRALFDALVATRLRDVAEFQGDLPGAPPHGFWVDAPAGTSVTVVDAGPSRVLELADHSAEARATAVRTFASTPEGSASLEVRIPSHASAPLDLQLRRQDHTFLAALRLQPDGKLAFHNGARGEGAFTATPVTWHAGEAHELRIEWTGQDSFSAYLDGTRFVSDEPLAAHGDPAEIALIAGTRASQGQAGQLDNLVVHAAPTQSVRERYRDNALWLAHCYANAQRCVDLLPGLLQKLDKHYQVETLFLNVGMLDTNGSLASRATGLRMLPAFFDALRNHELTGGRRFRVVAWLNGLMDPATAGALDLASDSVRTAITSEAARFVSPSADGSYVSSTARAFDGVQLDLEPSGPAPSASPSFVDLLQRIRSTWAMLGVDDRDLGIATHALGFGSKWRWGPEDFYALAPLVDHFAIMTYSVGITDGPAYRNWVEGQTRAILHAVSGHYWGDAAHPPHASAPKVFIGMPAMRRTAHHEPDAENIRWGAPGVDRAISAMISEGDPSVSSFAGIATYLHLDGADDSGYATWSTDWWWFGRHWLGAW